MFIWELCVDGLLDWVGYYCWFSEIIGLRIRIVLRLLVVMRVLYRFVQRRFCMFLVEFVSVAWASAWVHVAGVNFESNPLCCGFGI